MSWFYRFFKKDSDETQISVEGMNVYLNAATMRMDVSKPFYFGSGTVGIVAVATSVSPNVTGITGMDINSICIGGTAGLYRKTAAASTSWSSAATFW